MAHIRCFAAAADWVSRDGGAIGPASKPSSLGCLLSGVTQMTFFWHFPAKEAGQGHEVLRPEAMNVDTALIVRLCDRDSHAT
jgi:hypothetical protein